MRHPLLRWWAVHQGHLRAPSCVPSATPQAGTSWRALHHHEATAAARHLSAVLTKLPVCLPQGPPGPPGPRGPQGPGGADVRTVKCVPCAEAMRGRLGPFNSRWCQKFKGDNDTLIRCFRAQSSSTLYSLHVIFQEKKQAL